jgi:hypothetical protein
LRFRETCHQVTRVLSCGSSELRRQPGIVGPYWLGPTSSPLALFCLTALGLEVFRHLGRTRGCKHKRVLPPVFFDATAEYHRSDESSDPFAIPVSVDVCAGHRTERFRGLLRIRLSGLHPRVGPEVRAASRKQAGDKTPEWAGLPNAFHSRFGPVLGLRPMSSHLAAGDGRASSAELRHTTGKPVRGRVLQLGSPLAWRLVTGALRGFLLRVCLTGCPTASSGQRDRRTVRRGGPKVASHGLPTEVGSGQDTQREHNDTSHGVRFLSAR